MNLNFFLIIFLLINITISDINSAKENIKNIEKKTKVLGCSYLSNIFLSSMKDNDKLIKDILKDKNTNINESETKEKIYQLLLINCYLKISKDLANNIILEISKGNKDILKEKKYLDLFDLNKEKKGINEMKLASKEIKELLKEIKEEENLFKNKKDDPNFMKNFKEFEEKMKKNTQKNKSNQNQSNNNKKKKKKSGKKPYEGTKWEIVKPYHEDIFSFKNIIINPSKFFEQTGINTFCGMSIMTLIFINCIHSLYNNKNIEENKKEKEKEEDININKIENEEDENEDEEDEIIKEKNNDKNNIN